MLSKLDLVIEMDNHGQFSLDKILFHADHGFRIHEQLMDDNLYV